MALIWLEAERDIDPIGTVRAAVRSGRVTWGSLDAFVRHQLAENTELCCSDEQLREYVMALMSEP